MLEHRHLLSIDLVSAAASGEIGNAGGTTGHTGDTAYNPAVISTDGRYVAFTSGSTNLVENDANGQTDVFVKDLQTGTVTLVSVTSTGVQGDKKSSEPSISGDGRYVVFESSATNFGFGDTGSRAHVYLKDLVTGDLSVLDRDLEGRLDRHSSGTCCISSDGRYAAFESDANNLVEGDTNKAGDIFVVNLQTGERTLAGTDNSGNQANDGCGSASLSNDGHYVAFVSRADNLVADDTNEERDIFVKDLQSGAITRASTSSSGNQAIGGNSYSPNVSADGQYVAFRSDADNLVSGDTNNSWNVYVKNWQTGDIVMADTDAAGNHSNNDAYGTPSLSFDGRYVAFASDASNLVARNPGTWIDIFVKDLQTGAVVVLNTDLSGNEANDTSGTPSISSDGKYVAFWSLASDLIADDTNGSADVFRASVEFTPPTASLDAPHVAVEGGTSYTFTVAYTDDKAVYVATLDNADVRVTGPNGFDQAATLLSVDTNSNGTSRTATYRITPPGGAWDAADTGVYSVAVQFNQVTDTNGNAVAAGSLGTFTMDIDTPTAALDPPNAAVGGSTSYTFTVTYSDNIAVDVSSLGNTDLLVTGPKDFSQPATFVGVDTDSDGTPRTATYQITPPGGMWDSKDNGAYTVSVQSDEVTDTAGNPVAAGSLGTFTVKAKADRTKPTADLTAPNVTVAGGSTYTFTAAYTDNVEVDVATLDDADILVKGPNGFKQAASFVSVTPEGNGTPRAATYQITPSGGTWSPENNSVYTVWMQSKAVKDPSGNAVKSGKLGTFTVDTEVPTAAMKASNVTKNGGKSYTFTVTYTDNVAVDVSTLGSTDLVVTGPDGFLQSATLTKVSSRKDGTPRKATYKITPPDGKWSAANNGVYTVTLQADEATDTVGHAVPSGVLGTFTVDTAAPTAVLTDAPDVSTAGGETYTFTVTYTDNLAVSVATLDNFDVKVTGRRAYRQLATLVSVDTNSDGTPRTATYQITPKGEAWGSANNGVYTISMQSKQVKDIGGNSVKSGKLGTFTVNVPAASATDGTSTLARPLSGTASLNSTTLAAALHAALAPRRTAGPQMVFASIEDWL